MTKYHINPQTHMVGICKAKIHCDFGEHYTDEEQAVLASFEQDPELAHLAEDYLRSSHAMNNNIEKEILKDKERDSNRSLNAQGAKFATAGLAALGGLVGGVNAGIAITGAAASTSALTAGSALVMAGGAVAGVVAGPLVVFGVAAGAGVIAARVAKTRDRRKKKYAQILADDLGGSPEEYMNVDPLKAQTERVTMLRKKIDEKLIARGLDPKKVLLSETMIPENASYDY